MVKQRLSPHERLLAGENMSLGTALTHAVTLLHENEFDKAIDFLNYAQTKPLTRSKSNRALNEYLKKRYFGVSLADAKTAYCLYCKAQAHNWNFRVSMEKRSILAEDCLHNSQIFAPHDLHSHRELARLLVKRYGADSKEVLLHLINARKIRLASAQVEPFHVVIKPGLHVTFK